MQGNNYQNLPGLRVINVNGTNRSYILRKPPSDPRILIFLFHGGLGDGSIMENSCANLTEKAIAEGYAVVYPYGTGNGDGQGKNWPVRPNSPNLHRQVRATEVNFFNAIRHQVVSEICKGNNIPVVVAGHSMGGWLAGYLAMLGLADGLVLNASSVLQCDLDIIDNKKQSFEAIYIQSKKDRNIPKDGGQGCGVIKINHISQDEGLKILAECNGFENVKPVTFSNDKYTTSVYGGDNCVQVKSILTEDGGHSIAGGIKAIKTDGGDEPSGVVNFADEVVALAGRVIERKVVKEKPAEGKPNSFINTVCGMGR